MFQKGGTAPADNALGTNDAAAAVVLASEAPIKAHWREPVTRLVAYGHASVGPVYMGIGTVHATRAALERAGIAIAVLDIIETNEVLAAQACAVTRELGSDPAKANPKGSGISLGHPIRRYRRDRYHEACR